MSIESEDWDYIIEPRGSLFKLDLKGLWKYRDLLLLLVRRDFVAQYKQTILGPIWMVVQPILTSLTFVLIFGKIAGIGTDGIPSILFYLSGITPWSYFADCFTKSSSTFISNAAIFGKVYFPRLIMPLSVIISNLIKFSIQLLLFLSVWSWYLFNTELIHPKLEYIWLLPLLILMLAVMSLGFGLIVSSLTTKYRDLTFLLAFGIQLLMYATPIVYPLSIVGEKYRWIVLLNPISYVIESFKYIFLGSGSLDFQQLIYGGCFTVLLLFFSILVFNRVERSFIDTV